MVNKVMITGVGGLIGSHLAQKLLDQGNEVYGMDVVDVASSMNF